MSTITALGKVARRPPPSPELWGARLISSRGDANKPAGLPARPMLPSGKGKIHAARTRANPPAAQAPTRAARGCGDAPPRALEPRRRRGRVTRVDARACDPRCGAASDAASRFLERRFTDIFRDTTYVDESEKTSECSQTFATAYTLILQANTSNKRVPESSSSRPNAS